MFEINLLHNNVPHAAIPVNAAIEDLNHYILETSNKASLTPTPNLYYLYLIKNRENNFSKKAQIFIDTKIRQLPR